MRRREFITFLGSAAAACPFAARAQQQPKSYLVAYLALAGDEDAMSVEHRRNELSYTECRNLISDFRSADGKADRLPQLAAECLQPEPHVIIAGFGPLT